MGCCYSNSNNETSKKHEEVKKPLLKKDTQNKRDPETNDNLPHHAQETNASDSHHTIKETTVNVHKKEKAKSNKDTGPDNASNRDVKNQSKSPSIKGSVAGKHEKSKTLLVDIQEEDTSNNQKLDQLKYPSTDFENGTNKVEIDKITAKDNITSDETDEVGSVTKLTDHVYMNVTDSTLTDTPAAAEKEVQDDEQKADTNNVTDIPFIDNTSEGENDTTTSSLNSKKNEKSELVTDNVTTSNHETTVEVPENMSKENENDSITSNNDKNAIDQNSKENTKSEDIVQVPDFKYIASIDIGSTFSGYAFASTENPMDVQINSNWAAHKSYTSFKTPTVLLLDGNKNFAAFGFHAYDEYSRIMDEDEECLHTLHQNFKFDQNDNDMDELMPKALDYFRDKILEKLEKISEKSSKEFAADIKWLITVPCMWEDENKTAKLKAMWQKTSLSKSISTCFIPDNDATFIHCLSFKHGSGMIDKVLIMDAGGSSVVISLYVKESSSLPARWKLEKNLQTAGSGAITDKFIDTLNETLPNFIDKFKKEYPSSWIEFINYFNQAKTGAKPDEKIEFSIPLDFIFGQAYHEICGEMLEETFKKNPDSGFSLNKNKHLAITPATMDAFFKSTIDQIRNELNTILEDKSTENMAVFLTGGFSSSSYVIEMVKQEVKDVKVILPEDPNTCCMKGAVLYHSMYDMVMETSDIVFRHHESKA